MTVTVATIRGMNPYAFDDTAGDLRKAATKLRTECEAYQSKVEHPLAAKHGWRGGAQPDAEVVATINALAFGTSSMRLRASSNVLTGLCHALTNAQQRLTDAEREAARAGLSLDDDGVVREPATSAVPTGPRGGRAVTPASGDVDRLQRKVDGIVLFAMAADNLAKKQLASYTKPLITTQIADRGLLQQARDDNGAAAGDLLGSISVENLLSKAEPRALPPGHTLETVQRYFVAYAPAALDALAIFAGTWMEATATVDLALGRWAKPAAGDGPVAALAVGGALAIGAADLYLGNRITRWGGDRFHDDLAMARAETKGTESGATEERAAAIKKKNLDEAGKFDGTRMDHGLGSATRAEADRLGKEWVGPGYRIARDGRTLVSADETRTYRPPVVKKNGMAAGKTQANFEVRDPNGERGKRILSDGHLDITDP